MAQLNDIARAQQLLFESNVQLVQRDDVIYADENDNNIGDEFERTIAEEEALFYYNAATDKRNGFWTRFRAFLSGTNTAGRYGKALKDFALIFTPYGPAISNATEFITERLIKPEQTTNTMNESKPWYKSVTVNSIIVIIVIGAAQFFGIELTEAGLQDTIEAVGFAIASVTALWGRIRAQMKIGSNN